MSNMGIYIYGFMPNIYDTEQFRMLDGLGVYAIGHQNIAAIASNTNEPRLNDLDKESLGHLLVQHQKTIEEIGALNFNTIIPVKLGTIISSKEKAESILSGGYELITDTFKKIEALTEMDVAVTWTDLTKALQVIGNHPDVVKMKDNIRKNKNDISQIKHIKLGMLVQEKLKEKNKQLASDILETLSVHSLDMKTHEVMNDEMVSNAAFLISRNKCKDFENAVIQLDKEQNDLLNFKLVGPLPCYSFYTMEVKEIHAKQVIEAKKELELENIESAADIKRAYKDQAKIHHPDVSTGNSDPERFNRIHQAYLTLLDYAKAAGQSSKDDATLLFGEKNIEGLVLVKIKE